ncbi:hemagglutinin repeat-containing protein, partial [Paraburkholderia dinghuensis]
TNVIGSQVNGGQVTASVGGNLNIQSVQDTTQSNAHQSSAGGGFSISQAGGSVSFGAQNGHGDGTYAQVNEQAGINAGSGGFAVSVGGNTDLKGAVISSTADAEKNSLTTGTLTYSDIENHSHYSANSNGISAGVGIQNTGKALGPGSVSGAPAISPMITQSESGDSSATTRSAIGAGTISITDQADQTQDVSSLSRDTANTNGTVSATPDVQNLLNQQADTMQAAQAAGQVVAQGIGAYADKKRDTATDKATYDAWDEGGDNRALLQAAGGALIGGLGGGSIFTAAGGGVAAGLTSLAGKQLNELSKGIASETGSELLGNLVANIAANLGGALVGGTAGASTASSVDTYNRILDKGTEKDLPKELAMRAAAAGLTNPDGSPVTATQFANQLGLMGYSDISGTQSGAAATVYFGAPPQDGTTWITDTATGYSTQVLGAPNAALQKFILANTNGQDVPLPQQYSASPGVYPSGLSFNITGPFTKFDQADLDYVRTTTADVASMISTTAGRFGSVTAAAASLPSPYIPIFDSATYGATVVGITADGVSQLVRPNVGQYWQNGLTSVVSDRVSTINPIATPVVNEAANAFNASGIATSIQNSINSFWGGVVNSVKK